MISATPITSVQRFRPRILHTRLLDFEVQAERLIDPALTTRPIAVISSPKQNGTILTLSHEAIQEGLHQGIRVSLARKISQRTVLLPRNIALYQKVQGIIYRLLSRYSPFVEPSSYGQFFLDMSGTEKIFRSSTDAGHLLHKDIVRQINLSPRVGISRNKLVSSIVTQVVPSDPVLEIPPGSEAHFLSPLRSMALPVSDERPVREALLDLNLLIIKEVQLLVNYGHLSQAAFGIFARQVAAQAQGIDTSIVQPPQWRQQKERHIFERYTLPADTNDEALLHAAVQYLADVIGYQLRKRRNSAGEIKLFVHYTDGYENCARGSLKYHDAVTVTTTLLDLYHRANRRRNRIRAITIHATRLKAYAEQMNLFDTAMTKDQRLSSQLDEIRTKYGMGSVTTAASLTL